MSTLEEEVAHLQAMFPQEELHPDLVPWLCQGPMGTALKHPLVFDIVYSPMLAGRNNQTYLAKKAYAEEALAEGRWHTYVFTHERPYRSEALERIRARLGDVEYWHLLHDVWTDTENLHQWGERRIKTLIDAPRPGRYEHFMSDEDREVFEALPAQVTIHRGFADIYWMGWSWTLDEARAEWFAKRFAHRGLGQVMTATVPKKKIIAYLGDRNESEIVYNPRRLPRERKVRLV